MFKFISIKFFLYKIPICFRLNLYKTPTCFRHFIKKQLYFKQMKRNITKTLINWKKHPLRTPLIIRGARQVGKTYVIESFGKEEFQNSLTINFESSPQYFLCFETMDPVAIVSQIELISKRKIIPGKTLLFLDEIQQCPRALQSLRYFKEKLPELHVIAAGSLLEFAINDDNFSFPVGRVQFAKLFPLSFEEYLEASGDASLKEALYSFTIDSPPTSAIHNHLLSRVKDYFVIGGMPVSLLTHLKTHSLLETRYAQKSLWEAYESDFGKYANKSQHRHLRKIFTEIPRLIGDHIKYSRIDPSLPNPTREMKHAIELLRLAGLLHPIIATSAGSLPLLVGIRENIFKLLFLDIGLVNQIMDVDPLFPNIMTGPLAEQFVGQELIATADPLLDLKLFFWTREQGTAEVDYLFPFQGAVYPIEVKAGKSGKLKSLYLFLKEKKASFGIKISIDPLEWNNEVLSVPFYLTSHISRLLTGIKQS